DNNGKQAEIPLQVASDYVLIPVQAEFFVLEGLTQLLSVVDLVNTKLGRTLKILGMAVTMFSSRTKSSNEVLEDVRKHYPQHLFKTIIPRNVAVTDSTMVGEPIVTYRKNAPASEAYLELAK
ncbi:chromosome partitioning ATPase, partial [mine drainage metagenome]